MKFKLKQLNAGRWFKVFKIVTVGRFDYIFSYTDWQEWRKSVRMEIQRQLDGRPDGWYFCDEDDIKQEAEEDIDLLEFHATAFALHK